MARARNEGRLFSKIEWPKDPDIVRSCGSTLFLTLFLHNIVCVYKDSFILFGVTDRASEAAAPSSHCKGLCS